MALSKQDILKELTFKTSRSGGKGGQHVNKVSTKVELNFNLRLSSLFTEEEKSRLFQKLANRINSEGILQVITEEERSQLQNKERSVQKLLVLLKTALFLPKMRKASKPKRSAIEKRLKSKQITSLKKINRKNDWND
ncbi:alternative ribosome rescue aminoacyl-tRNA hydrolase ArfB [Daejeonella sp.]|jgi:ribosome-associated protein|uniref:alternative ribosome rescue aminoacyl-tRNA hydrolase ArfB n=1 Tax=Daejeonella sp. TaxID=2805397 RepID=UPI003783E7E9